MQKTTSVLVASLALNFPTASHAAAPQSTPYADVSELVTLFSDLCINSFGSDAALEAAVTGKGATSMPAADLQRYLHSDPGEGWYYRTPVALYAVSLERPPYHTCAVRRMTPEGPGQGISTFAASIRAYATTIGGKTVAIPSTQSQLQNGPTVTSFGIGVLDAAAKPRDTFGVFLSNYHGRVPPPWVADGTPGVGVEVRLSRTIIGR